MSDATEPRRYTRRQRNALYRAAGGRCEKCGDPLPTDWHADHDLPYSRGGKTLLINGRALCPACNLKKGNRVSFQDTFVPRSFQRAITDAVMDGIVAGRRTTVVEASPGSGKTLAYQACATELWRAGLIDYAAVFVPRIILAKQCETSWMARVPDPVTGGEKWGGNHALFDAAKRFGFIQHIQNRTPLIEPGRLGVGYVQTYSSLVTDPAIYEDWARAHQGRYLLVADEAQFCGAGDEQGGTRAGGYIERLAEFAGHTLLLTGTPYRADGRPLVLAEYTEPDETGVQRLVSHASATYADGVADNYLRRFEAQMTKIRVRRRFVPDTVVEYDVTDDGSDLRDALRMPEVWQPLVDGVVEALRDKQAKNRQYRALISCMEQGEARAVRKYLLEQHAGLTVEIAVSDDGPAAETALRKFQRKTDAGDILVTVRKAFIGYDCPQITVVGVLTHYRDKGHLMQLVGRGLRVWTAEGATEQSCRVIAPDDDRMSDFVDFMRGQSEMGLRRREQRQAAADLLPGGKKDDPDPLSVMESAWATTTRGVSNDVELGQYDYELMAAIKREVGSTDDVTTVARIVELAGMKLGAVRPDLATSTTSDGAPDVVPMTERERIGQINAKVSRAIAAAVFARGISKDDPRFGEEVARMTAAVNRMSGATARQVRTVERAMHRLAAAEEVATGALA